MNETAARFDNRQAPAHTLVLFGSTGDLAKRKLFPALYRMHRAGLLPEGFTLVAVGRRDYDDDAFRVVFYQAIREFARLPAISDEEWLECAKKIRYCRVDMTQPSEFDRLRDMVTEIEQARGGPANRLFYVSMAPEFFGPVALSLKDCGLASPEETGGWRRLVIEKPFGHDHASAQELNEQLCQGFAEEQVYRIDHYLGKEMVQNIEVLRFANSIFEPVWNNRSIANIQITSSETVGVEERAPYYEKAGALRDMVQNHMLQMVMMLAMEPPSRLRTEDIRDEKVKVLRSLRRYSVDEVGQYVVRGQYVPGFINGRTVLGYSQEKGVAADSKTETFVAARLFIDNFRWAGVPFYLRTGKRMNIKSTEIVIQFRDMPKHLYFNQDGNLGPNLLVIRINPVEGMYIQLNAKQPGTDGRVVPVAMEFSQTADNSPEAYERLLHDAMRGDSTYFTRWTKCLSLGNLSTPSQRPLAATPAFLSNSTKLDHGVRLRRIACPSRTASTGGPSLARTHPPSNRFLNRRPPGPGDEYLADH